MLYSKIEYLIALTGLEGFEYLRNKYSFEIESQEINELVQILRASAEAESRQQHFHVSFRSK